MFRSMGCLCEQEAEIVVLPLNIEYVERCGVNHRATGNSLFSAGEVRYRNDPPRLPRWHF